MTLDVMHGHTIIMGSIVPIMICLMLFLGKVIGGGEIKPKSLNVSVIMYLVGTVGSLILLFYKGINIETIVHSGVLDFAQVNGALFGGSVGMIVIILSQAKDCRVKKCLVCYFPHIDGFWIGNVRSFILPHFN